jgi:benzoylformate decarboxylase
LFFPASGGLGWGLPAAIGLQLGNPSRRVLAMLGDGALHYTVSALWTAAHYRVPVVFVVARNGEYGALRKFTQVMQAPGVPGLDLPDIDVTGIAAAYGVPAIRVDSLTELTTAVKAALSSDGPRLIEVPQQPLSAS